MEPVAPTDEPRGRRLGILLALAASLAGALGFGRVFPLPQVAWAALIGTGIGGLCGWWRVSRRDRFAVATVAWTVVAALLAGTLSAMVAAVPREANPASALADSYHAVVGGLHRVLTITLPAPPTAELLPLVAVTAAVAAVLAALLAGSGRQVGALAPGLVVLAGALALGVGGPESTVTVTLPYLVVAVVNLGVEGWNRAGRQVSRLLPIVAVGAVAVAVSVPAAQLDHALHRNALNPRQAVSAALEVPPAADPLSLVSYWLEHPKQVLFTAQVGSVWDRLRPFWSLASYDDYNGASWAGQTQAEAVGYQVPGSPPDGASTSPVTIETENLSGVWVPIPGPVHKVDRVGLGYSTGSRELVDPSGVNGKRYRLQVYLPNYRVDSLRAAAVPQGSAAAELVSVPSCAPPQLATLAHQVTAGAHLPIQQAVALEGVLSAKSGFALDNSAAPGDSCAQITQFLTHDHSGTADQFATTFVLMARSIGLPARLVVGFQSGSVSEGGRFVTVTGADAFVFPEVELAQVGWVPIDTTPKGGPGSGKGFSQTQLAEIEHAGQPTPATSNPTFHHHRQPSPAATRPRPAHHGPGFPVVAAVAMASGAVVLLALGLLAATRLRLWRRRHARRPPPTRVSLAWRHVLDRLADHRVAVESLTPAEAVDAVAPLSRRAAKPVGELGALVERAVYDTSQLSEREADRAWRQALVADRELRRRLPRATRWLTALGFRPRRRLVGTPHPARP